MRELKHRSDIKQGQCLLERELIRKVVSGFAPSEKKREKETEKREALLRMCDYGATLRVQGTKLLYSCRQTILKLVEGWLCP